jgi:type IV pilus assembly protein PilV
MANSSRRSELGATLIEALVAALLFVLGIVGLMGTMGVVIGNQADVQFRSEASRLAQTMLNNVWLNVDRTSAATTVASLQAFSHLPTSNPNQACNFSGTASTNALVTAWVDSMTSASGSAKLPGATNTMQQIVVDTATNNQVTITLCWQSSGDAVPRQYVLRSFIN